MVNLRITSATIFRKAGGAWALLLFSSCAFLGGCALGSGSSEDVITECVLPTDQAKTLAGKWATLPVPVAFHQGDFSSEEIAAIVAAADTWNSFYLASRGTQAIDYGASGAIRVSSQPSPASDPCTQGIVSGSRYTGQVILYKRSIWPQPALADKTIALTTFCTNKRTTPLPTLYMAYMEVNYQGFFVSGRKMPDLQTIVAHEFGHLLGLYHSCDSGSTKAGTPNCLSSELDPTYRQALMFPVFGFSADRTGELKRSIASNDQGRANCLYTASGSSE